MAKKLTRLGALHHIFEENGISPDIIELNDSRYYICSIGEDVNEFERAAKSNTNRCWLR